MSLDLFFKRKVDEKLIDKTTRKEDDIEVHSGYFVKKKLYDKMFKHQKEGVKWLFVIHQQNKGCVLADDMGLGKTLQTIALLTSLFRYNQIKSVLIVAPTTLLINWNKEFTNWTPGFEKFVNVIDGSVQPNKRSQLIAKVQLNGGILMMTYNLARTLQEQLSQHHKQEFKWDYVILDEAHKIKNQSKTTKEINRLPSRFRLAITGTPVQNNLSELWSIFNFAMQGSLLGTYTTFKTTFEKPITTSRQKDASLREKVLGNKIAKQLRKMYEPYLLRRTKEEVFASDKLDSNVLSRSGKISLPPKYDWCLWIKMNETQIRLYKDFLESDEVKALLANREAVKSPLMQLLVLKKICDHPRLLTKNTFEKLIYNEDVDLDELNTVDVSVDVLLKESSKLSVLNQLLKMLINEKHKVLLFSTSTKMLDIIEKVLRLNRINFCRLDGQVLSNSKREQIVNRFRTDSSLQLMILTVQVGGVGLTLIEASRVIIYDPNWNPGTDSQAVDRAHRIGQKNSNVIVYRFMTSTGVEEKIYSRQVFKDSLTKQTIGKENDPARYFTSTDLFELFKIGDFRKSKVCDDFNEIHGTLEEKLLKQLEDSDAQTELTQEQQSVLRHKEQIRSKIEEIYDISEHSLVFSKVTETLNTSGIDYAYLNNEVNTAKDLLLKENKLANGSHVSNLERAQIVSAKQKLLTQKFGTEFLPLGDKFNQYRDGNNKFEFKRPKPPQVNIVNLDDEDDIQFVDNNTLTNKSNAINSNNSSSSSLVSNLTTDKNANLIANSSSSYLTSDNNSILSSKAPSPNKSIYHQNLTDNNEDVVELSFDLSVMDIDEQAIEKSNDLNDLLTSFDTSIRLDDDEFEKQKNDTDDSIIILD